VTSPNSTIPYTWRPYAAIAAWALPGLGHYLLGQRRRAVVLAVAIIGLWFAGLFIGGISVIDHRDETTMRPSKFSLWFLGQMLIGPSLIVDLYHQQLKSDSQMTFGHLPEPEDQPQPLYVPSQGRVYEIGVLYTSLAGMLNLMAILDVLYADPRRKNHAPRPPAEPQDPEAAR